jgi:hypothetical protein
MTGLAELVTELRRAADQTPLHVAVLPGMGLEVLGAALFAPHSRWLEIRGRKIRLGFSRDRLGSRDFYHLSIDSQAADRLEPDDLAAIVAAFFPGDQPLAFPSVLGNTVQFLGTPFANGTGLSKDEG